MALFTKKDLENYLQLTAQPADGSPNGDGPPGVSDATYGVVSRVVDGWLLDAAGKAEWPSSYAEEPPPQLFSWAVELGAIVHENPAAATTDTTDKVTVSWDARKRVEAILTRVAAWSRGEGYDGDTAAPARPQGSFPAPRVYPSPELRRPLRGRL